MIGDLKFRVSMEMKIVCLVKIFENPVQNEQTGDLNIIDNLELIGDLKLRVSMEIEIVYLVKIFENQGQNE